MSATSLALRPEKSGTRNHRPGNDEVAAMDFLGERRGDDADRQRHNDQAGEYRYRGDKTARPGNRNDVAVADRSEGHDRPPHGVRNRSKLVRLNAALDEMHRGCGEQRKTEQYGQAADQSSPLGVQSLEQRLVGRRVAGELEKTQDPQYEQNPKIGRQEKCEPEREDGDEINQAVWAEDEPGPAARSAQLAGGRELGGDPEAKTIFQREYR